MEDLATIEEWLDYISQIPMMEMISHAKVIGSVSFEEDRCADRGGWKQRVTLRHIA